MMVIVTYDVNITSDGGARRLSQVSKACKNYGLRVQNSVFECVLDESQFCGLKNELSEIIDKKSDSIRFYLLGNNWQKRVEQIGSLASIDVENGIFVI